MVSGAISEAVLANLADARYFQHGGNLMVNELFIRDKGMNLLGLDQ